MEIAASSPSAIEAKNFSKCDGSMPREIEPRNSPSDPVTLRAMMVVHAPDRRLYTGSSNTAGDRGPDENTLNQLRSATLSSGTGHTLDALISLPLASNRLTPPT